MLSWEEFAHPSVDDISDYRKHVERAIQSPEGPFDRITPVDGLSNVAQFLDSEVNRYSKFRRWYYRVVAESPNRERVVSEVVTFDLIIPTQTQLIVNEIQRNERILLRGIGSTPGTLGVPVLLFIRRKFGTRCSCWDPIQQQLTNEQCLDCYGVSFTGGYMDPILTWVNPDKDLEMIDLDPISVREVLTGKFWTTNYPEISFGDLIIFQTGVRYEVMRKNVTQLQGVNSRQILDVTTIPPGDVRYKVPFDSSILEGAR